MFRIPRRALSLRWLVPSVVALGMAVGLGIALTTQDSSAQTVEITQDGQLLDYASVTDAKEHVSAKVGFDVKIPTKIPAGYEVGGIGSVGRWSEAVVTLRPKDKSTMDSFILITQRPTRFAPPNEQSGAQKLSFSVQGVDVYELETEKAVSYTVLTPDRGFNINRIPAPTTSAQQEMLAMIESLVK